MSAFIKTVCRRVNTDCSQEAVNIIDERANEFLMKNNISYDDIKKFSITTLSTNPSVGGSSKSEAGGYVYLIYTFIIDKSNTI